MITVSATAVYAQKSPAKFGKPLASDFSSTVCPIDSGANAFCIFDFATLRFNLDFNLGWTWQLERHTKIRIVSEEGKSHGNIFLAYIDGRYSDENIYNLKGYTYNVVEGKIEKTEISKENIFDDKITEFLRGKKVAMSNVKAGSVIEIKYTIISGFLGTPPRWEFQKDIPVLRSELFIDLKNKSEDLNGLLVFNPLLSGRLEENPLKLEERKFPVDFSYPMNEQSIYRITLPENYSIISVPESMVVQTPDKDAIFRYSAGAKGKVIQISVTCRIGKTRFLPSGYKELRAFFNEMVGKEAELVTVSSSEQQKMNSAFSNHEN